MVNWKKWFLEEDEDEIFEEEISRKEKKESIMKMEKILRQTLVLENLREHLKKMSLNQILETEEKERKLKRTLKTMKK